MIHPTEQFFMFAAPYRTILPAHDFPDTLGPPVPEIPGSALVWRIPTAGVAPALDLVSRRRGGLSLAVILPRADRPLPRRELLEIVSRGRPHTVLPHMQELDPGELRASISRPPSNLSAEVTDYLAWRGIRPDDETLRMLRRTLDLSAEVRTVSGLARGLYTSRRALGRRFMNRGLPVPSHWLHFGRILRAVMRLQTSDDNLFTVACRLGYPDGFALSNQMRRLTGTRPSQAREYLGWEWVLESWLRKEAEAGALAPRAFTRSIPPGIPCNMDRLPRARARAASLPRDSVPSGVGTKRAVVGSRPLPGLDRAGR